MATKKASPKPKASVRKATTTKAAPADQAPENPPVAEVDPDSLTNAAVNTRPLDEAAIQANYPPAEPPPAGVTSPQA